MPSIYFDLDGTLIDVRRRHYAAYAAALRELGCEPLPEGTYWARRRRGAASADLIGSEDESLRQRFLEGWLARVETPAYLRMDRRVPGAIEALDALRDSYHLVLVTLRRERTALQEQLEALRLHDPFVAVISRSDAAGTDSKVELIRSHAGRLEAGSIVVGDAEADVEAARALKLACVCVTTGVRDESYLRRLHPDILIESVAHLPDALAQTAGLALARPSP